MKHIGKVIAAITVSALVGLSTYSLHPAQSEMADKLDGYTQVIEKDLSDDVVCGGSYKLTDVERGSAVKGFMEEVELYHRLTFTSSRGSIVYVDANSHLYTENGRVYSQTSLTDQRYVVAQLVKNAFVECLGGVK